MKRTVGKFRSQGGLTMLEVVSVLVIIALLGAVAISRVSSISQSALKTNTEKLKVHLRYAQLRALNSTERVWGINFSSDHYQLFYSLASDTGASNVHYVSFPGGEGSNIDLSKSNTTITFDGNPLSFDTWGKPYKNLRANFYSPVQQDADRTITLTDSSGNTETITITKNTGYIP